MTEPRTASELLTITCRLEQPTLIRALDLATCNSYFPGATFRCPRCRVDGAYETSTWAWTCIPGRHGGTVAELALLAASWPAAMATLLQASEVG